MVWQGQDPSQLLPAQRHQIQRLRHSWCRQPQDVSKRKLEKTTFFGEETYGILLQKRCYLAGMKVCSLYPVTSRTSIVWNILARLISHLYYQQIQGILHIWMVLAATHTFHSTIFQNPGAAPPPFSSFAARIFVCENNLVVLISQIKFRATVPFRP